MLRLVCSRYRHVDHTLTISKSLQCSYSNSHSCSYRSCNTNSYSSSYTYSCSYNSESCRINNSYKYNHTYSNTSSYSSINSDGHNPSHNHSYSIDNIEQKYEELVRSWPGNYLQPINMLFQRIRENHNYELIANNKHIDTNNWNDYLNRYRRSIIKLPLETLGSKEDLINFCSIVDNYMNILVTNQKLLEKQSKHNKTEDDKGSELVQQIQLLSNNQLSNWKPNSDSFEDVLVNDILSKAAVDLADVIAAYSVLATTSDLRFPHNWYPLTRLTKRKVFYHGGPTNSGKVKLQLLCYYY